MTQEELAKDWLSRASGKWRLQVLQRRGRNVPKGGGEWERKELPLRLRRFLNGTPVGLVHDVLRLLDTDVTLKDPVFNWEPAGTVDPEKYKPVRTYIVKDGNPNESNGRDPTYTIVQDLRLADDDGDDLDITDMSACAQESETRYVWDASDVESAPAGGQGVSWRVTNVTRDQETDLYSYQLRKETAITQHQGPRVTECGEFETVTQESWDNLYGEPGSFRDQDDAPVDVPEPCDAPDGTTVRVQVSENPDCTFKVVVTTSVAKERTQVTEARKSLRGVTETVRTVATSPMPETGLALGEQVRNELRPDGRYDVTHVTASHESVGDIGSDCERTVFEHQHSEVRNEADRPEREGAEAGGGKVYKVASRATEEGTWDVTRSETTELRAEKARHSKRKTLRGVTETWTDRNVTDNGVSVSSIGDEVVVEETPGGLWNRTVTKVSGESVGDIGSNCETTVFQHTHVESENVAERPEKEASSAGGGKTYQVQSRATEEGTWDVSRTETTELPVTGAQHIKRKTLRGVTETVVHRNVDDSSVEVSEIGDEVRVEQTPGGRWNRTETHASHEAVGEIGKSCTVTPVVHTDTTVSNVPDGSQPEPQHQNPEVNVEKTVETRRTEEGTWDVTERTATHQPWGVKRVAESETAVRRTEFHEFRNLETVPDMQAPEGTIVSPQVSRNSVGSFDGGYTKIVAKSKDSGWITWNATVKSPTQTLTYEHGVRVFKNLQSVPTPPSGTSCNVDCSINEYGLYDGKLTYSRLLSWDTGGGGGGGSSHTFETSEAVYGTWRRMEVSTYVGRTPPASVIGEGIVNGFPGGLQVVRKTTR